MKFSHNINHFHLFCGIGGGALGFKRGHVRVGNTGAKFQCLGGIDVDPGTIFDFQQLTGTPGTVLYMFSRNQYIAFHGYEPPSDLTICMLQRATNVPTSSFLVCHARALGPAPANTSNNLALN